MRVPIVDHPLVGTDEERAALAEYRECQATMAITRGDGPDRKKTTVSDGASTVMLGEEKDLGSSNVLSDGDKHCFHFDEVIAFWADISSLNSDGSLPAILYLWPLDPDGTEGREVRCTIRAAALDRLEKHGAKRLPRPILNE